MLNKIACHTYEHIHISMAHARTQIHTQHTGVVVGSRDTMRIAMKNGKFVVEYNGGQRGGWR